MRGGQVVHDTGQRVELNNDKYRQADIDSLAWLKDPYSHSGWAPTLPPGVASWTDTSNSEASLANKIGFSTNRREDACQSRRRQEPGRGRHASDQVLRPKVPGPNGRALMGAGVSLNFNALDTSNCWVDVVGEVLAEKSPAEAVKAAHDRAVRTFKESGAKGEYLREA